MAINLIDRINEILESDDADDRILSADALLLEAMLRIQELEENARQTKSCADQVEMLTAALQKCNASNSRLAQKNHELNTKLESLKDFHSWY